MLSAQSWNLVLAVFPSNISMALKTVIILTQESTLVCGGEYTGAGAGVVGMAGCEYGEGYTGGGYVACIGCWYGGG